MREIKGDLNREPFHVHVLEDSLLKKSQFSKCDLYIKHNPKQIPSKLSCGYQQTVSKVLQKGKKD